MKSEVGMHRNPLIFRKNRLIESVALRAIRPNIGRREESFWLTH
ncbi:MAG: hypothetical protein WCY13_02790 [Candidatus Cloacimonadaceae bacterium]